MAQITLITGVPGHGKSLLAITRGLKFVAEGRTVYAAGFKELDYEGTGFKPLPTAFEAFDPSNLDDVKPVPNIMPDWMLLQDAVIIYDECYSVLPSRAAGARVPVHVNALARHRHYNIDLIFITQKHEQIDNFVRGLVNEHIHVRRKWGFDGAVLKTWDAFQLNTERTADHAPLWKYPKANYKLYKSATAHSVKKRVPWFIWAPIPLLALIGGLVWYAVHAFGAKAHAAGPSASLDAGGTGAGSASPQARIKSTDDTLRQRDYAAWLRPRIAGQPWTAPAYDQLQPQSVPRVFCMAMEDGRCGCVTEQGTRYELKLDVCRAVARDGVYNPFVGSKSDQFASADRRDRQGDGQGVPDQSNATDLGGAQGYWPSSQMRGDYQPPEHTITTRQMQ